jgi:ankyrin repeat protein
LPKTKFILKFAIYFLLFSFIESVKPQNNEDHGEIQLKLDEKTIYAELYKSCERGDIKRVIYLVEEYAPDLNKKNKRGVAPLIIASTSGSKDVVQYLLSKEIDINTTDKSGNTAILSSLLRGHLEITKILLEKKPKLNLKNKKGTNPLLISSANGYKDILDLILSRDVDINHQDDEGNTALHYSTLEGHMECIEILLQKGINIKIKNKKGKTPVSIASESGITDLMELFRTHPNTRNRLRFVMIGEVISDTNSEGLISLKPKASTINLIKQNQILYLIDESETEVGSGKIYLINPKFIRFKVDSGKIDLGNRAGYFE